VTQNILADGRIVSDLTGHIIKANDAPEIYEMIRRKNARIQSRMAEAERAAATEKERAS
jgi:hypothetical protein